MIGLDLHDSDGGMPKRLPHQEVRRPFRCILNAIGPVMFGALILCAVNAFVSRQTARISYTSPDRHLVRDEVRLEMQRQMSVAVARERYPDLGIPGSPLLEAVQAREESLRDSGDTALDDPGYPLRLTEEEADLLGIRPLPTVLLR